MKWKFILYLLGIVSLLWIAGIVLLPPLNNYLSLKEELNEIKRENEQLKKEITSLREEEEKVKNDTFFLEYLIRKELKMIKPKEKVYRVK